MSVFEYLRHQMDSLTAKRIGKNIRINGIAYQAIDAYFMAELGPIQGNSVSYIVFSQNYHPQRGDEVEVDNHIYKVTRYQQFNGKPHIWII
ncbi:ATP-binding protein [Proteus sp. G2639]|uniref:ATP-binding protein n=1 Tax=Proteus TaxID=583 RepID=UPI0013780115|nr:ATP-binding protein [Proteus terrae]MBG5950308.1 ATP-binding protein [Proteus terrae]NBN61991.1 ATP-binding protein [Proteus sp. G2639]